MMRVDNSVPIIFCSAEGSPWRAVCNSIQEGCLSMSSESVKEKLKEKKYGAEHVIRYPSIDNLFTEPHARLFVALTLCMTLVVVSLNTIPLRPSNSVQL